MILSCDHIYKEFVTGAVLIDCSFHVNEGEKVAIIGANGTGKSTLLKIIINELSADNGTVSISKDTTIGYLAQHQDIYSDNTIYEEVLSVKKDLITMENHIRMMEKQMKHLEGDELNTLLEAYTKASHDFELRNGYSYKSEVSGVLKGLGYSEEDFNKKISTLSGGQKTRVALAKLLLTNADIILLDEPTNHLDVASISWLETFLSNYKGAVILVSHDRFFLDKIVTKVVEIENCHSTVFKGNYTDFSVKKEAMLEAKYNAYLKQQKEISHQQEVIDTLRSYKQEKFYKRAQSREKTLKSMDIIENPNTTSNSFNFTLNPKITSGNDVLMIDGLTKQYDNMCLFENLSFNITRGERVAIIGSNGTGKTTILKIINNIITPDNGTVKYGTNVTVGYYDQEHCVLDENKTLFDEISDAYPYLTNTEIRNTLAAFMFTQDEVFKTISTLSGGERGRLSLAKLMLSNANLLILDEPTNHLDIISKQILENALNNYTGTVLFVSHDRYFINKTSTRILELKNKKIINYLGNYDYYLSKCDEMAQKFAPDIIDKNDFETSSKKDVWLAMKEEKSRIKRLENEHKNTENEIFELENFLGEIEEQINLPKNSTDVALLTSLCTQKEELTVKLKDLYEKWENLSNLLMN